MSHPALGLPPSDPRAGQPATAARLRAAQGRLPAQSLAAALRIDPTLQDRYDEPMRRLFLRDYGGHIEQLARAMETGEARFVVIYGETLVPVYRRREVPMNDAVTLLRGLEDAATSIVPTEDGPAIREVMGHWIERMRRHRRLPGDHEGNRIVRFFWKAAGLGDDSVV